MRPIKLTISAFGPYADKQVIDFEELNGRNIFVISGKTGAGKTTIFDAISYALYGEASGESRETDSLRSHFADDDVETFVELEFELKGERYTVNRVPKQKKKKSRGEGFTEKSADATLTLPDGKVITKVTNVTNKLIEILGITRDQFKQIVMLPQGEFKKLLLADSLEREGIFRKIFNTYDFEKIQIDLKEKAISLSKNRNKSKDEMQTNLKNIKGEHDIVIEEYVDFPFVIEKLKDFILKDSEGYKNLNEDDKALYNELELINKEKVKIENNNNLLKEKEKIEKSLLDLINKEKEFEIKKETINKCKSAKEVKYIEDKLIENENILEQRKKSYEETLLNIERLNKETDTAKLNLKIEEAKEPERDALKLEINKLESIKPKIAEFDELKNSLIIKTESIESIKCKIEDNKKVNENFKKQKLENENKLKEIATAETKKVEIANEISNKEKIIQETRELFKIIASYEKSKLSHNNLKIEYDSFEKVYKSIKKNYNDMDELYKKEQAGILACSLKENTPCPVCGSKNHPNLAVISKNLIVPTKEELKIAKEKLEEAEKENNLKINELTKLNTDCKNYFDILSNSLLKFSKTLNIDENYSAKTAEIVKLKGIELKVNIDDLNKELIKTNEKLSMKKNIDEQNIIIENSLVEVEKELSTLEKTEKILLPEIAQINTRIQEYKKEIPKAILDIKTLEILLNDKTKELEISLNNLNKLRVYNENISKQLEGEISKSNEIKSSMEELKSNIEKIKLEFNTLLKNLGFNNFNNYEEFKSKICLIKDLEKEVEDYYLNLKLLKSKKEDIVIKTKDLSFIDIDSIDEKVKKLQEEKKGLELRLRELYSVLENNKSILKNVESLNAKFKAIEEEYKVVGELADLANGKKSPYISFERYILASYFEDIIEAANIRLEKMTGDRFSLIRKKSKSKGAGQKGLELEIYDNYTDSSRDVSSLSGGESFKASLSLALGLSDVVQSNAGGVSLDTMFVDEGFGTLDPQSLDNAIDSLLELQRGGRLVGIISHVEELKERIDAKLEVTSTAKGSKAEFDIL
ncbi:AAA family ATPase [Paraclostridium bifermentans]|uniref:AAA family ATPase n=1 Tax=Paraclostridium bifermentans TaxID=1490 RepID=UPI001C11DF67|nr:AAA family ATPase [Paraclostridium bifermentans]MBU5288054.1 AAA family ATPase [Paraclostridium bifermentans]